MLDHLATPGPSIVVKGTEFADCPGLSQIPPLKQEE